MFIYGACSFVTFSFYFLIDEIQFFFNKHHRNRRKKFYFLIRHSMHFENIFFKLVFGVKFFLMCPVSLLQLLII